MIKRVIKRDGRVKEFNSDRIITAIRKCYDEVYGSGTSRDSECIKITNDVLYHIGLDSRSEVHIEDIQDSVVSLLEDNNLNVAKAYSDYRNKRTEEREKNILIYNKINEVLENVSPEARENANKSGDKVQSIRAMVSDIALRDYNRSKKIPSNLLKEHNKRIYIHDDMYFGLPFHNCFLINWRDMLDNGFNIDNTYVRTPNGLRTAVTLLSQIVARCSSSCYGGVTLADLCIGLQPYAEKSLNKHREVAISEKIEDVEGYAWRRLEKEAYDSFQDLLYSINCLCTSRGEVPFVTISYGLGEGKIARLLQNSILDVRIKGFENGVTPIFPKEIFILKKGHNLNPNDENYDILQKAIKCSSLRIYPDYISYDKVIETTGDYKTCMSCRSFLGSYKDGNGNFITDSRFNAGVMSINIPRLAITSKGDEKKFYNDLYECLQLCKQGLMFRYETLSKVRAKQANILWTEGAIARLDPEDSIKPLLENGFCSYSIGFIGISNAVKSLYGIDFCPENKESIVKGKQILKYIKDYCDKITKETGLGFSPYSTPFETGATKLCKQDQLDFGIIEGVNDLGYYTNSFHFDSDKDISPFDKIDFESNFMSLATGGAIQYTEYPSMVNNTEALEDVIRYAYDKVHYFGINVKPDICLKCDYHGQMVSTNETENEYKCPNCDNEDTSLMSIVRRICGYTSELSLRKTVDNKMKEINNRKDHFKA